MSRSGSPAGVSFFDVAAALREVGRAHNGQCHYQVCLPVREVRGVALDIRVRFIRRLGGLHDGLYERGVSGKFPNLRSRTFAGELLALAYELDAKLTQEAEQGKRATQGRFDW